MNEDRSDDPSGSKPVLTLCYEKFERVFGCTGDAMWDAVRQCAWRGARAAAASRPDVWDDAASEAVVYYLERGADVIQHDGAVRKNVRGLGAMRAISIARRPRGDEPDPNTVAPGLDVQEKIEAAQCAKQLLALLRRVNSTYRPHLMMWLRLVVTGEAEKKGVNTVIARQLGRPVGTIDSLLSRAKRELRLLALEEHFTCAFSLQREQLTLAFELLTEWMVAS